MFEVLKNRGNISAIAEANIENMLENQPVVQFIYELMGHIVFKLVNFMKNIRLGVMKLVRRQFLKLNLGEN